MKTSKRLKLEAAGWAVGSAADFLGLSEEEATLIEMKLALADSIRERRQKKHLTQQGACPTPRAQPIPCGQDGSRRRFGVAGPTVKMAFGPKKPPTTWEAHNRDGVGKGDLMIGIPFIRNPS